MLRQNMLIVFPKDRHPCYKLWKHGKPTVFKVKMCDKSNTVNPWSDVDSAYWCSME